MSASEERRRLTKLLCQIAKLASYRLDKAVPLADVGSNVDCQQIPSKFFLADGCKDPSSELLTYDLNVSMFEKLIHPVRVNCTADRFGQSIGGTPALLVTKDGMDIVHDAERSWLSKSIDKQPITFLQIIVTLILAAISFVAGFVAGHMA